VVKIIVLALALGLVACKHKAPTICSPEANAKWIEFPDNTTKRVIPMQCTDGCTVYMSTDNPAQKVNSCSVQPICMLSDNGPVTVSYPDGVSRKSDMFLCSNGCTRYTYVNDGSIKFDQCQ
jgi:hypothetical protein